MTTATTSLQLKTLLAVPDDEQLIQSAIELLDSNFKTVDDLRDLTSVLENKQREHNRLQSNLEASQLNVDALIASTRTSVSDHLNTAQELSLVRHSLTDELSCLNDELTASKSDDGEHQPTLLEDIETLHRDLKELHSLKEYVIVIEHATKLSEASTQQIQDAPPSQPVSLASISQYSALHDFVEKAIMQCSSVEDQAGQQILHLITFMRNLREKAWQGMKDTMSSRLLSASEALKWPHPIDYSTASPEQRQAFEYAFINLLRFQGLASKVRPFAEKEGLYPIQTLVHPISLRFKYHFESSRQTNQLDKPEWYFTHILNVAHEHKSFMDTIVGHLLSSGQLQGVNAWDEFVSLLIPIIARKLRRIIPVLLPHPSLLAHTVYQALAFDAALKEEGFQISLTSTPKDAWEGTSQIILGQKEWFDAWVEGERKFTEEQYNGIISSPDAWLIADDDGDEEKIQSDFRTTHSARQIKALVEQVTDRYAPLPDFAHRTRFLIVVQLPVLEHYHDRVSTSLDAFETLSSAFVRAVPGALGVTLGNSRDGEGRVKMDTARLTSGVEGVQRLCKALVSAQYMESTMEAWGEDLFFLELWAEINRRASLRVKATENPNLPDPSANEAEAPEDTIFEELVIQYRKLVTRAESMIVQQACGEIDAGLKAHFALITSVASEQQTDDVALSQALLGPVALLASYLSYLRSVLSEALLTRVYRSIATHLAEHILNRGILYRGRFDLRAAKSILAECELWVETCHAGVRGAMSRSRIEAPWLSLLESARLVSLEGEIWQLMLEATFGTLSDDVWNETVAEVSGLRQLGREQVGRLLKCRVDCSQ